MTHRSFPTDPPCDECEALLQALLEARDADRSDVRRRLLDTARASGRTPGAMRDAWLRSVAAMSEAEMATVRRALAPRAEDVRRRQLAHELETGHSPAPLMSATLLGYRRRRNPPPR